jgi:hypothetical protein
MSADEPDSGRVLRVATWNVAAVNNNPFEYFITHHDPAYNELMADFEAFIDSPGDGDVTVGEIIDDAMFEELVAEMRAHGIDGVDATAEYWHAHIKPRRIVSGFLKDKAIGAKRLCSMPDRVTNTINAAEGVLYRPTVINCYAQDMPTVRSWWEQWRRFMFHTKATPLSSKVGGDAAPRDVCHLLDPIQMSKYPAVTASEEAISVPLQTACMAAFDGILVHLVNKLAPGKWHGVKREMVKALNENKTRRTLDILASPAYRSCDVFFVQEAAAALVRDLESHSELGERYHVLYPEKLDGKRDQNSLVLCSKKRFDVDDPSWRGETTTAVTGFVAKDAPAGVAPGDLFCVRVVERSSRKNEKDGGRYLLASFHGDTNGLATVPVVDAVDKHALLPDPTTPNEKTPKTPPRLVFGMDANTHKTHEESKKQGVSDFAAHLEKIGLVSCWGVEPDPRAHTTFNARTYLQPQLNKAVRFAERATSSSTDKHPKDHIVFRLGTFDVRIVTRDNTGEGEFVDDTPFPTLTFPSDHALVCAELVEEA